MYINKTCDLISQCIHTFHLISDGHVTKYDAAMTMAKEYVNKMTVPEFRIVLNDDHFDNAQWDYLKDATASKVMSDLIYECVFVIAKDFVAEIDRITEIMNRKDISDDDFPEPEGFSK